MNFFPRVVLSCSILTSFSTIATQTQFVFMDNVCISPIADFRCIEVFPLSADGYSMDFNIHDDAGCFWIGDKSIRLNNEVLTEPRLKQRLAEQMEIVVGFDHFDFDGFISFLTETDDITVRYIYLNTYLKEQKLTYGQYCQLLSLFPNNKDYVGIFIGRMLRPRNLSLIMREMLNSGYALSDELKILWLRALKCSVGKEVAIAWVHGIQSNEARKKALNYLPEGIIQTPGERAKVHFLNLLAHYNNDNLDQFLPAYHEACAVKKTRKQKVLSTLNHFWHRRK